MPVKIWQMPKIEFRNNTLMAICLGMGFSDCGDNELLIESAEWNKTIKWKNGEEGFKSAVTEWVKNWVKQNIEPIVLPERMKTNNIMPELFDARIRGFNSCIGTILTNNPNLIVEESE